MFRLRMNLLKQSDLGVNMKQQLIPVWLKSEIFQVNDTQWWKSMAPAISPVTLCEKTDYPVHKFPNKGVACHPAFSLTRKALEVTDDAHCNNHFGVQVSTMSKDDIGFSFQLLHFFKIEHIIFLEDAKRPARYNERTHTAAVEVVGNGPGTTEKEPWQMKHSLDVPRFYSCFLMSD